MGRPNPHREKRIVWSANDRAIELTNIQIERFWKKVSKSWSGCWNWIGASVAPPGGKARYGAYSVLVAPGKRKTLKAHRIAYMLATGLNPSPLDVLHRCDNTLCVRPSHLFVGTHADNMHDMIAKGRWRGQASQNSKKSHCRNGHLLSGNNLYVKPNGQRQCKKCRAAAQRRYKRRQQ
jgi:hypothetical protein